MVVCYFWKTTIGLKKPHFMEHFNNYNKYRVLISIIYYFDVFIIFLYYVKKEL